VTPDRDSSDPPAGSYLRQVRRDERLADKVADLLKQAILSGQLAAGDRLPPERILGDRFGVSRTVIREAIRSLAAKGMVEVRSGSGTVVARVGASSVAETMQLYLRGASIGDDLVDEVRAMVEVHVAGVAAERATETALDDMREALRSMVVTAQDVEFRRCVARATHNPLYLVMLDALGPPSGSVMTLAACARLVDCIAARDAEGARQAMRAHQADSRQACEQLLVKDRRA
jgi:GntR family transcriptional regulator, transcriptional repressor for pyruvate dehydrogenase complex